MPVQKERPVFSIIIPAYNEASYLPKCLGCIHAAIEASAAPTEIIVVDNASADRTAEIAQEAGARVVMETEKNLSKIRNRGAREASGEYLVFVDADSYMSPNMLVAIRKVMETGRYVGGGVANIITDRMSLGIFMTFMLAIPYGLWVRTAVCLFYLRRETFFAIDGFNEARYTLEDVDFAQRLMRYGRKHGLRYKNLLRARLVTSARKFDEYGDWFVFRRPLFIWKAFLNHRGVAHDLWYRSRRLPQHEQR